MLITMGLENLKKKVTLSKGFILRYLLPPFLVMLIMGYTLFFLALPSFEKNLYKNQEEFLRQISNAAISLVNSKYELVQAGKMDEFEARKEAISDIESLRFGKSNDEYCWISDTNSFVIMHPYRNELNGKDASEFQNSEGEYIFKNFADVAKSKGGGIVEYKWQYFDDSTLNRAKLSYVKLFKPWGWVIGSGIYKNELDAVINYEKEKFIYYYLFILFGVSAIVFYFAIRNQKTETKKASYMHALERSEAQFRAFAEQSVVGIIIINDSEVIFFNEAFENILGVKGGDLKILNASLFEKLSQIHKINPNESDLETNASEISIIKQDGTEMWLRCFSKQINYADESARLIMFADITSNKKAEIAVLEANQYLEEKVSERTFLLDNALRELRIKNNELENIKFKLEKSLIEEKKLNKLKSEFIASVSHEFRTPLSVIQTSFDVIKAMIQRNQVQNIESFFNKIMLSIRNITNLMDDIFVIGKTDDKLIDLNLEFQELEPNIISIIYEYETKQRERIIFSSALDKNFYCETDFKFLRILINNIISNALKYSTDFVNISVQEVDQKAMITISDKGKGISEEDQLMIFQPFFRTNDNIAIVHGSGLGLAIVKQCADALKVDIKVSSEINKGTEFKIIINKNFPA